MICIRVQSAWCRVIGSGLLVCTRGEAEDDAVLQHREHDGRHPWWYSTSRSTIWISCPSRRSCGVWHDSRQRHGCSVRTPHIHPQGRRPPRGLDDQPRRAELARAHLRSVNPGEMVGSQSSPRRAETEEIWYHRDRCATVSQVAARAEAFRFGALAQLVARFHGMEEVRGSNPLCSTSWSLFKPTTFPV